MGDNREAVPQHVTGAAGTAKPSRLRIAIDGPAGVGKTTSARALAGRLGYLYLDTGAMYRALTFLVLQSGISVDDEQAISQVVSNCSIQLSSSNDDLDYPARVWINGE